MDRFCEFEASLLYRTARATERNPVLKNNTKVTRTDEEYVLIIVYQDLCALWKGEVLMDRHRAMTDPHLERTYSVPFQEGHALNYLKKKKKISN